MRRVYLDYNATTPIHPEVARFVGPFLRELFGNPSSIHWAGRDTRPFVDKARNPALGICVSQLGLLVLAAYGLDCMRSSAVTATHSFRRTSLLLWSAGALIWATLFLLWIIGKDKVFLYDSTAIAGMAAVFIGTLYWAAAGRRIRWVAAAAAIVCTAVLEFGVVTGATFFSREQGWNLVDTLYSYSDLADFLRKQGIVRVGMDKAEIPFNFGDWYGVDEIHGYAGVTKNVVRVAFEPHARLLLGENFYIGRKTAREGQAPVFERPDGIRIFKNSDAFPRVWSVHETTTLASSEDIPGAFGQPLQNLRRAAFFVGSKPSVEQCTEPDTLALEARESAKYVIEADMKCTGLVVLGETFSPGWVASVDSKPAQVYEAYGVVSAVQVPAGRHRVVFVYQPRSVHLGLLLASLGLVAFSACVAFTFYTAPGRERKH